MSLEEFASKFPLLIQTQADNRWVGPSGTYLVVNEPSELPTNVGFKVVTTNVGAE